jgi:hypothetical protein
MVAATPGFANYFHNPHWGLSLNNGSAPNPTPRDIRGNRVPQLFRARRRPTAASAKPSRLTPSRHGRWLPNSAQVRRTRFHKPQKRAQARDAS